MSLSLVLAVAAVLQTASAPAAASSKPGAPPAKTARADDNKPICEMMDVTGSMFQRKVCLTRAGWDQMTAGSQDFMQHNTGAGTQVPAATH